MRLFLIWLQFFSGDGKDNIYSKLICKLHFQFWVQNLNCHSVLADGNPEAAGALPRGSRGCGLLPGAPVSPTPEDLLYFRSAVGSQFGKQNLHGRFFVADMGPADRKRVTYSFIENLPWKLLLLLRARVTASNS